MNNLSNHLININKKNVIECIELPKYVYKYINWDKDYHRRILYNSEIFFTSSRNFNDPFDSTVPFRYELGTEEQVLKLYIEHFRHDFPLLSEAEVQINAKKELLINDIRDPERIQYYIKIQRDYIANKFGIFSVTNRNDSILMWSHYSNMHKGICIRINCNMFRDFMETECVRNDLILYWNNVEYKKEYPILNPFEFNDEEAYLKSLLIKSHDWKYESELRFILLDKTNTAINIPIGIIDQIILGCRTSKKDVKIITEFAKKTNIDVLQAFLKQNSFGLDFHKTVRVPDI